MCEPSTVAVLGAGGYVGGALARRLHGPGVRLRLVGRRPPTVGPDLTAGEVHRHAADVTDPRAVRDLVADADVVVVSVLYAPHGSWRDADADPVAARRVNVGVVESVLAAVGSARDPALPPPVVVVPGTASLDHAASLNHATSLDSTASLDHSAHGEFSRYEQHKAEAEDLLMEATRRGGVRGISLRLPTVYGSAGPGGTVGRGVVAGILRTALDDRPLTIWGDGSAERDLVHIRDVADAVGRAVAAPDGLAGRPWSIGTGEAVTLTRLFTLAAQAAAARLGRTPVPVEYVEPPDGATPTDARSSVVDPGPFSEQTGWIASTRLEEGLRQTCDVLARE
ncbi:NAD-dependent epimerase/dehydratase family protein [Dietzia cercidiphylli]|uniref:NAD-dependent epimerase/dehydratase domain-containing protein n=1 Tax=Dietzia cercidiphylli TaxID=498199 RepID=A0ABP4UE53_9ACTN|nr:NAD(P)-dependent oxidoreductase [Dietzia cercidiphylli]MBB1048769.1 NAD(P)-dependent oxidoreductase [Dietzia cercidiphylli]